jgi:hypothetical protein
LGGHHCNAQAWLLQIAKMQAIYGSGFARFACNSRVSASAFFLLNAGGTLGFDDQQNELHEHVGIGHPNTA